MAGHPGKKLLFMGSEFGQFDEWKDMEFGQLDWQLTDQFEMHRKINVYVKHLNYLYKQQPALWELIINRKDSNGSMLIMQSKVSYHS
jgi:1,4-alpha-glucan branching enzyme